MNNASRNPATPHGDKLKALLRNPRLPDVDGPRVEAAIGRYKAWIRALNGVEPGSLDAVHRLVGVTNQYRTTVELDLIFDSPSDFLYRQKGQLKLDNTVLEEFLPQLCARALRLPDLDMELGPRQTFAGLSFGSSLADSGGAGRPLIREKNQDFVLGRRIQFMLAFDSEFGDAERLSSCLGYVCVECKTNLDKTMFQEAAATSRDLKMAIPSSLYFLVCEYLDMTPISISSTHIDDVLIVRKQKRLPSSVRQEYRTAAARRERRDAYVEFLDASPWSSDVFERMIRRIQRGVDDKAPAADQVLERGHF